MDVGYGQLAGSLRQDPRVRNMERTNISDVRPESLDPPPSLGVMDLSYLSLSVAVPVVASLLVQDDPDREIVALVKPLFEVPASGPDLSRSSMRRRSGERAVPAQRRGCALRRPWHRRCWAPRARWSSWCCFGRFRSGCRQGRSRTRSGNRDSVSPIDDMIAEALDEGEAVLKGDDRRSDLL